MIQVSQVAKAFGGQTLFEEVSFRIESGHRLALVGPNGAGKSTLFSLLLGTDTPDQGEIVREGQPRIGHLPQETAPVEGESVIEIAAGITPEHARLRRIIAAGEGTDETSSEAYHLAVARYAEIGGYQTEARAKGILAGLAFRPGDEDRPARELSGGWVMRAHLARLLTAAPDLLMLDEPTNHLDLESLGWFQRHLQEYPGAIFLISHDREFINNLATGILEIRHQRLHRYTGNYDAYLIESAARRTQQEASHKNQQRKIEHLERFVTRFGAKASKASQAKSKQKQIDRIERINLPQEESRSIRIRFPQPSPSGQRVLRLEDVHFAYGQHVVYRGINLDVERGQRVVLVGPNGAGKSTLLKLLGGVLHPTAGLREPGPKTQVGYYAQSRMEMLKPGRTVLEEALAVPRPVNDLTARSLLGAFLFQGDAVFKPVSVLSGGEKSRLALVKLLLAPPNLLLMDEPTTHLDMASIDALVEALEGYQGTLIFISHDVYFIRKIARTVLHISGGKLTPYAGDYDYYLFKSQATNARQALTAGAPPGDQRPADIKPSSATAKAAATNPGFKSKEQKRAEAQARQQRAAQQAELTELEDKICRLEETQTKLSQRLEDPDLYESDPAAVMQINRDLMATQESLEKLNTQWLTLSEALTGED